MSGVLISHCYIIGNVMLSVVV